MPTLDPVSDNGTSQATQFDARSHFFLEDGLFTPQSQGQAFGVVSNKVFSTTARVSVFNKKIISICTGHVFIQPQSGPQADPTKVNVILKPYKQPIGGLLIKFIVYRGLPKADFFDPSNKLVATGSEFITKIRSEFSSFYTGSGQAVPDFPATFIGYPGTTSTQQETDLLDKYFFKISQTFDSETGSLTDPLLAYELPFVQAGTHLCTSSGEIGMDIVLNEGNCINNAEPSPFVLNLSFARAVSHVLDVDTVNTAAEKRLLREASTMFIDIAAFYGVHAGGGSISLYGSAAPANSKPAIAGLLANFYTRNYVYIYTYSRIGNDRTISTGISTVQVQTPVT